MADKADEITNATDHQQHSQNLRQKAGFINKIPKREQPKAPEYLEDQDAVIIPFEKQHHFCVQLLPGENFQMISIVQYCQNIIFILQVDERNGNAYHCKKNHEFCDRLINGPQQRI